jgi:hypothetical protein
MIMAKRNVGRPRIPGNENLQPLGQRIDADSATALDRVCDRHGWTRRASCEVALLILDAIDARVSGVITCRDDLLQVTKELLDAVIGEGKIIEPSRKRFLPVRES